MAISSLLEGKIVAITGASRGIGAAIATAFAATGARLALTAQDGPGLEQIARQFTKDFGTECLTYAGDVSDATSVHEFYTQLFKQFGRLDVLVANAGILGDGLIGMIGAADIARVLQVNVAGTLHHMQAASRLMRRHKSGSMILMSSIVGRCGHRGQMPYAASKAALLGAMLSAAKELGTDGIRVNAIAPGVIETDMTKNLSTEMRRELLASIAINRFGDATEVADVALFLASDMARYVSGQIIGVDGCMVM